MTLDLWDRAVPRIHHGLRVVQHAFNTILKRTVYWNGPDGQQWENADGQLRTANGVSSAPLRMDAFAPWCWKPRRSITCGYGIDSMHPLIPAEMDAVAIDRFGGPEVLRVQPITPVRSKLRAGIAPGVLRARGGSA